MTIQENHPLAPLTWFRTGGPARYFAEPATAAEFAEALPFAREHKLEIFVLGEGANILVSDEGFDGLVIRPQLTNVVVNNTLVTAGAGMSLHDLIDICLNHNLTGLEEFSGIPGTVGGSVYINLHYFEYLLEQFLESATVIDRETGIVTTVDRNWFAFGYNDSTLLNGTHFLVNATFRLKKETDLAVAYARGRRAEIIRHRSRRYPTARTCGSFFRNFTEDELVSCTDPNPVRFVAYYLDKVRVKGALRCGKAAVSYRHANMIVTEEGATSGDVIDVAQEMQRRVFETFGIVPQAECRLIGFTDDELYVCPEPVEGLNKVSTRFAENPLVSNTPSKKLPHP